MSTCQLIYSQMMTIGERLKAERQRLGMNQDDFAAVGGVKKGAQINYEQDKRSPDADYLVRVMDVGVDVAYVVTGQFKATTLSQDESELINGFRKLDLRGKAGVIALINGMSTSAQNNVKGDVGQVVQGNVQGPITINLKTKLKKNE